VKPAAAVHRRQRRIANPVRFDSDHRGARAIEPASSRPSASTTLQRAPSARAVRRAEHNQQRQVFDDIDKTVFLAGRHKNDQPWAYLD
jgi:hypothetical protein